MKTYLSRVLCLLLCLALIFSLAACGNKNTSSFNLDDDDSWDIDDGDDVDTGDDADIDDTTSDGKTGNKKAADAVADADSLSLAQLVAKMPSKLRGTTIKVCSWNPVTDVTDADKVVKKFESQTGIKVKWNQVSYDDYDSKVTSLISAKNSPDLIRFITPAPSRMYLCQDLKTATGYDFKGAIWDSRVTSSYTYKGKIYAANLKDTLNQQVSVLEYRPSQIKRYKFEDPYTLWKNGQWTYDKFKDICRAFKAEVGHPAWMTSSVLDYLWFNDIDLISFNTKTQKYEQNLASPKVINGLQEIIRNRGDISPEAASANDKFEDGTYLFYSNNVLTARTTDFHLTELKAKNDLEAVPFPTQPGKTYYTNFQEFEAYGVPKGANNGPAAYYFMRFYLYPGNYNESTFFCSTKILEVYKYLMSQTNYNFNVERQITAAAGNAYGNVNTMVRTGEMTVDQVKSKLDSVTPFFNKAVNQANALLDKMG